MVDFLDTFFVSSRCPQDETAAAVRLQGRQITVAADNHPTSHHTANPTAATHPTTMMSAYSGALSDMPRIGAF